MTNRADVDRLDRAQVQAVSLAQTDLEQYFRGVRGNSPEAVRDALLEIVPALTEEYGDVAATAAAEWYEEVRFKDIGGNYSAQLGANASTDAVEGSVRYAAGNLWDREVPIIDPATGEILGYRMVPASNQAVLTALGGAIQRHVAYSGRNTIARNVQLDPRRPRFARMTMGGNTCAFCAVMASRGWVYHTRETAGLNNDYHDNCNCRIVPQFERGNAHIEGYDPDELYDLYQVARDSIGDAQASEIASELRRLFPDRFDH